MVEEEHAEAVFGYQADDYEQPLEGAGWRLANSLVVLKSEVGAYAPNRKKGYDGTIGDAAHASRPSRHNPNLKGVVCALDITHDPDGGMDVHALARRLAKTPHPNLAYIISDRQIAKRSEGFKWRRYGGASPHDKHAHMAAGVGPDAEPRPPYDDLTAWGVAVVPKPKPAKRTLRVTRPLMHGDDVTWVQRQLCAILIPVEVDGYYGQETANAIELFQRSRMLTADGICGPVTMRYLEKS